MAMLKINNIDMPAPKPDGYKVSLQDIDSENTRRTETGIMTRDRIRAGVYRLDVTWLVKKSNLKTITDAVKEQQFPVTFFDPTSSGNCSCTMYVGDRVGSLIYYDKGAPSESLWELTLALIEI